jgi:hypothetical protein
VLLKTQKCILACTLSFPALSSLNIFTVPEATTVSTVSTHASAQSSSPDGILSTSFTPLSLDPVAISDSLLPQSDQKAVELTDRASVAIEGIIQDYINLNTLVHSYIWQKHLEALSTQRRASAGTIGKHYNLSSSILCAFRKIIQSVRATRMLLSLSEVETQAVPAKLDIPRYFNFNSLLIVQEGKGELEEGSYIPLRFVPFGPLPSHLLNLGSSRKKPVAPETPERSDLAIRGATELCYQ